ncbi:hypothetical protein MP638_000805, partial [Amoeboaphelidium occidentale]
MDTTQQTQDNSRPASLVEGMMTHLFHKLVKMQQQNQELMASVVALQSQARGRGEDEKKDGQYRLHTATTWLKQLEQGFNAERVNDDTRRIAYAANSLRGPALEWWYTIDAFNGWEHFKEALILEFTPDNQQHLLRRNLQKLKQNRFILKYVTKFRELIG